MRVFFFILFCILNLYAHPHFFVDASIDIKENKIVHKWLFDRINSRLLTFEFDKNRNKTFEKEEQLAFIETHFEKLKGDNYNLFMEIDEDELVADPINVEVKLLNRQLELSFELLIKVKKGGTICTIDPTLYFAYKLKDAKSVYKSEIQKSEHDYCLGVIR